MRPGRITPSETRDDVCDGCSTFWRVCLMQRSPVDDAHLCPECFEDEALGADVAMNEPHCACRGVCSVCTPGA